MTWERVAFGVLGPVVAEGDGGALALKGPRHRAVLARLIVARRRVVPVARLVEDLWDEPPAGAVGAVQTFVGALRRALEPDRPPRTRARLLVTEGPGYALRAAPDAVDAWRFEAAVGAAATLPPTAALRRLGEALELWRGPAYAEFEAEPWTRAERSRLAELRLRAVEQRAETLLALGRPAEAVPDLNAHLTDHPWREDAWRLLALALYRADRQADALSALRRARTTLTTHLGLDPGPRLRRLEADILAQDPALEAPPGMIAPACGEPSPTPPLPEPGAPPRTPLGLRPSPRPGRCPAPRRGPAPGSRLGLAREATTDSGPAPSSGPPPGPPPTAEATTRAAPEEPPGAAARVWAEAADVYGRTVGGGARARLEAAVGLIRNLAVTGGDGLEAARQHRLAAITAAEECGDPELTARVIGAYDVPAIWTRGDDPELAARIVGAAERALAALPSPPEGSAARCRLLATIALESRGTRSPRGPEAAREAEGIARRLDDPALLVFALNGAFMQACTRAGLAPRRDAIGAELVAVAARHGLVTYEVLGHLVRLQARCALGDFAAADGHAAVADRLAARHELPLVGVFTEWYAALRLAAAGRTARAEAAYRAAAGRLAGAGMPGVERGLLPLALLCLRLSGGERSAREAADRGVAPGAGGGVDLGAARGADPSAGRSTDLDAGQGADPGTGLGVDLGADWGTNLGAGRGAAPGADRSTDPGAGQGADPGAGLGVDLGVGRSADPSAGQGADPGADRSTDPGAGLGVGPSTDQGIDPSTDRSADPGADRGIDPSAGRGVGLGADLGVDLDADWGPYRPWAEPFALPAEKARAALRALPEPPADLLYEALCCLEAAAALRLGDRDALHRAHARLLPASGQLAGAGSGLLTLGPVDRHLSAIAAALGPRPRG
ncbi:BTAD domain-containing putative transcriptional regulator [Streptomyces sp. NPDC059850]|uniref:BTAD domain-containing putative transcriptional regulator n=1 Tax=Streptomyces sp. NPDC059850 TaxID=3346970 RepID=UPI00365DB891